MDLFRKKKLRIIKQVWILYWTLLIIIYWIVLFSLLYLYLFSYINFLTLIVLYCSWLLVYSIFKWNIVKLQTKYKQWKQVDGLLKYVYIFFRERVRSVFVSIGFLFIFLWYQNDYSPYYVYQYEMENRTTWQKVVFQEMVHIWSSDYYDKVAQDINKKSKEWYTLYYEELVPTEAEWSEKTYKDFLLSTMLQKLEEEKNGITTHQNITKQQNDTFVFNSQKAVRADTSKEILGNNLEKEPIINYYRSDIESIKNEALVYLFLKNSWKQKELREEIIDKIKTGEIWPNELGTIEKTISDIYNSNKQISINDLENMSLDNISEKTDILYNALNSNNTSAYIAKWFTNFVFKINAHMNQKSWVNSTTLMCTIVSSDFCDTFQTRVLDYRNKVLVEYVLSKNDEKIFITYWQAHFSGFFEYLNKKSLDKWEWEFIILSKKKIKVL